MAASSNEDADDSNFHSCYSQLEARSMILENPPPNS